MFKNREAINPDRVDTIIGEVSRIEGKVTGDGSIRVDGRIEGEVDIQGDFIVGEKGNVVATVSAKNMSIAGYVEGNITVSGRLEILSTGKLVGNAKVGTLVIEEGAGFKGQCEMSISSGTEGKRAARLFGNAEKETAAAKES